MAVCSVPYCNTKRGDARMHVLPQDPKYFEIWAQAIGRNDLDISKRRNVRICDLHFSDEMKFPAHHNRTNLVRNAIPTINVHVPKPKIKQSENKNVPKLVEDAANKIGMPVHKLTNYNFPGEIQTEPTSNSVQNENLQISQDETSISSTQLCETESLCRICFCNEDLCDLSDPMYYGELKILEKIADIKFAENNFNCVCSKCKSYLEFILLFSSTCKKANDVLQLMADNSVDILKTVEHIQRESFNNDIKFDNNSLRSRNEMLTNFHNHILKHIETINTQSEEFKKVEIKISNKEDIIEIHEENDEDLNGALKNNRNSLNNEVLRVLNYMQKIPKHKEENEPNEYKENLERALKDYLEKRSSINFDQLLSPERENNKFANPSKTTRIVERKNEEVKLKMVSGSQRAAKTGLKCSKEVSNASKVKIVVTDVSKIKQITGFHVENKEILKESKPKPKNKKNIQSLGFKYFRVCVKPRTNYYCQKCNLTFSEGKERLKHHYAVHALKLVCAICGKMVLRNRMDRHLLSHQQKNILCDFCGEKFDSIVAFYAHRRNHVPTKRRRRNLKNCKICGMEVTNLRNHVAMTHRAQFKCSTCNKTYLSLDSLDNHKLVHCSDVPYSCEFCGKGFTMKSHLNHHLTVHGQYVTKFKCKICNENVKSLKDMRAHINEFHHKEPTELSSCQLCPKVFKTKQGLAAHMRCHNQNYTCPYCSQQFVLEHLLNRHIESHTGNYRFKCHLCDEGFSYIQSLNHHIETHNEESKQCSICSKVFEHKKYLRKHMVVHNEKRYMCVYCNKMFTFKQNLESHVQCVHIDEKPYQCSKCDKRMFAKKNYLQHIKKCTGAKVERIYSSDDDLLPVVVNDSTNDVYFDNIQEKIDANIIWK